MHKIQSKGRFQKKKKKKIEALTKGVNITNYRNIERA